MNEKNAEEYKSLFVTYFDGVYDIPPHYENLPNTFQMGVCKLEYDEKDNRLNVYLRRPGLLIGEKGKTLNAIIEYLGCNIGVYEFNLERD